MVPFYALLALKALQSPEKPPAEHPVLPQFYRPPSRGPVLCEVTMKAKKFGRTAGTDNLTLPVPSDYTGEWVIGFRVQTEPPAALDSWKWNRLLDGLNSAVTVSLKSGYREVGISYSARILLPETDVIRTEKKDFAAWAGPSASIQSTDPEIVAVAEKLKAGASDRSEITAKVVPWVAKNHEDTNRSALPKDAKAALTGGGDSIGRANLCTAILRACGIPARIVEYFPTSPRGGDSLDWLTEYATDDGTWQRVDPRVGLLYPARNSMVVLFIPGQDAENRWGSGSAGPWPSAPPMFSATPLWTYEGSTIKVIKTFPGPSGSRLMPAAHRRYLKVLDSATHGHDNWPDEPTFTQAISKGPTDLALFLDHPPITH